MTIPTECVKRCEPVNAYGDAHVEGVTLEPKLDDLSIAIVG